MARKPAKKYFYNSLIRIINKLSSKELIQFRDFVNSSYHNKSRKLISFLDGHLRINAKNSLKRNSEEFLEKKIKDFSSVNDSTYRHLVRDLTILFEKFLVVREVENDTPLWYDVFFESVLKADMQEIFGLRFVKFDKNIRKQIKTDSMSLLSMFNIEGYKLSYFSVLFNDSLKETEMKVSTRKSRQAYLQLFYLIELIKELDEMMNINKQTDIKIDSSIPVLSQRIGLYKKLFDLLKVNLKSGDILKAADVYMNLYNLILDTSNSRYYTRYKKILIQNAKLFSVRELTYLFNKLNEINLINLKSKPEINKYHREIIYIYTIILENEYYEKIFGKYMPLGLYRNILIISANLKLLDWAEKFIQLYIPKIVPSERKNILHYSRALVYFQREKYEQALASIKKISLRKVSITLDIKVLLLKLYYILSHSEPALLLISSFKRYLRNNKSISVKRKIMYLNFLSVMKLLIRNKFDNTRVDLEYIKRKLLITDEIIQKNWLIQILNKLIASKKITN